MARLKKAIARSLGWVSLLQLQPMRVGPATTSSIHTPVCPPSSAMLPMNMLGLSGWGGSSGKLAASTPSIHRVAVLALLSMPISAQNQRLVTSVTQFGQLPDRAPSGATPSVGTALMVAQD